MKEVVAKWNWLVSDSGKYGILWNHMMIMLISKISHGSFPKQEIDYCFKREISQLFQQSGNKQRSNKRLLEKANHIFKSKQQACTWYWNTT